MENREFKGIYMAAKETRYLKNNPGYIVQISYDVKRDRIWADFQTQNSYIVYDNPDIISVFVKEPATQKEIKGLIINKLECMAA